MTRGIKHEVDRYINNLLAQPMAYVKEGETTAQNVVQLAVRPIQLWELVFPKATLPEVLKMVDYNPDYRPELNKHIFAMRKILKAKKIPDIDLTKIPDRFLYKQNIATYPIGIKLDGINTEGPFKGFEML